jgi:23S rRNA pseudouridine1911/1915/1917 synthase
MTRAELQKVGHEPPPIELEVRPEEVGERLDIVLSRRDLGLSRAAVQQLIAAERVLLSGRPARASLRVKTAGERLLVRPLPPPPSTAEPEDLPVEVLHEDPHILVVVKAAGMVVHPAPGHGSGTLVNALRFRQSVRELEDNETERPGIVHRLDKETSGVMVVAKTVAARAGLIEQFQAHSLERAYCAIALGNLPARQTFETTHARHPVDRKRFTGKLARGKRALTHVRVLEQLEGAAYIECRLETGRTHQIRMHLSEAGFPILADKLYGRSTRDVRLQAAAEAIGRQALHAQLLGFQHPCTGEAMRFEAPAPADFLRALAWLRNAPARRPQ